VGRNRDVKGTGDDTAIGILTRPTTHAATVLDTSDVNADRFGSRGSPDTLATLRLERVPGPLGLWHREHGEDRLSAGFRFGQTILS